MQWIAICALILAGGCWGLGFPLGKLALAELGPAHMVLLRFAVATAVSAPLVLARRETRAVFRSPAVIAAGVFYGLGFLLQFEGLAGVSITLAALLVDALPALIAVCAQLMGERLNGLAWGGVAAATLGAALIAGKPDGAGAPLGIALSIGSLFVFVAWFVALKRAPDGPTPLAVPAATIVIAALTILPVALVLHGAPKVQLSPTAWAGIVGQGLLSTVLATAAWQFGSTRVGSATAGVFINLEPLIGAACGVLLFGDRLTPSLAAGGAMILLGSLAVVMGEQKATLSVAPEAPATPA